MDQPDYKRHLHDGREFKRLVNLGWKLDDIAARGGHTIEHVRAMLHLQEIPDVLRRLVEADVLSAATVLDAYRSHNEDGAATMRALCAGVTGLDEMGLDRRAAGVPAATIYIDDCLKVLASQPAETIDAIITDPPFEIGMYGKNWDRTGIAFSPTLWKALYKVLKPGGYIAALCSGRRYHRLAVAAEDAGFALFPFMVWKHLQALPKPANVSELFDRDNLADRPIIGYRSGSGFTTANGVQGQQSRLTTEFPVYARHVSAEAQHWEGWYYGRSAITPSIKPILLAQKPAKFERMIDNLRSYRTGALNIGALRTRNGGGWPTLELDYTGRKKEVHGSTHPTVKPLALMEDLCLLLCPREATVLDPFAGTGSTGLAALRQGFGCLLIDNDPAMRSEITRRMRESQFDFEFVS
jgi:site-specific DNA-methyltransferase (adenine-specific)